MDETPEQDPVAALLAISTPLERAAAITAYGRSLGNLPPVLAKQRKADLAASRAEMSAGQIAIRLRLRRSGVFRLTRPTAQEA